MDQFYSQVVQIEWEFIFLQSKFYWIWYNIFPYETTVAHVPCVKIVRFHGLESSLNYNRKMLVK